MNKLIDKLYTESPHFKAQLDILMNISNWMNEKPYRKLLLKLLYIPIWITILLLIKFLIF